MIKGKLKKLIKSLEEEEETETIVNVYKHSYNVCKHFNLHFTHLYFCHWKTVIHNSLQN